MKLLFDQNLSRHLVRELESEFAGSAHVSSLGLDTAADHEIWAYAGENDYLIVSKDSDFRQLAFLAGPPPKALWLRVGNSPTAAIGELLRANQAVITRFANSRDQALLVLPGVDL